MNRLEIQNLEAVCDFHGCPDIFDFFYHEICESLGNIDKSSELVERCYQAALGSKDPKGTVRRLLNEEVKKTIAEVDGPI